MKSYKNTITESRIQPAATIMRKQMPTALVDNRPASRGTQVAQLVKTPAAELPPQPYNISSLYDGARRFFGSFASPHLAEFHEGLMSDPNSIAHQPANWYTGREAGMAENKFLNNLEYPTYDRRTDYFARNRLAMTLRPYAAAAAGGMMDAHYRARLLKYNLKQIMRRPPFL